VVEQNNLNYEKAIQAVIAQNIETTETAIQVNTQKISRDIMEFVITPYINKVSGVIIATAEKDIVSVAKTVFESLSVTGVELNKEVVCVTLNQLLKSREEQRLKRVKSNVSKEQTEEQQGEIEDAKD